MEDTRDVDEEDVDVDLESVAAEPDIDEKPVRWSRAEARRRGIPSKKTIAVRRITQLDLAAGRTELRVLGADEPYDRPKTRGDCANVPRPCPYVACRANMYLDVSPTGSIILNFPHLEPHQMVPNQSCALDLAERGGMTLEQIAVAFSLTRERVRQIELKSLATLLGELKEKDIDQADVMGVMNRYVTGPGGELADSGIDGEMPSDVTSLIQSGEPPK